MKTKTKWILGGVFGALFLLWTMLVWKVDVAPIGANGTDVGLSHLNETIFRLTGANTVFYTVTEVTGYLAIACGACFMCVGAVQWLKRKNLFKVDMEILLLGVLFATAIGMYLLFNHVEINYRPIILPGETEAELSYPSSHTLLACVMYGGILMMLGKYVKNGVLLRCLKIACIVLLTVTVLGRTLSGVHWYSDIIGSLLLAMAMLCLFAGAYGTLRKKKKAAFRAAKKAAQEEQA